MATPRGTPLRRCERRPQRDEGCHCRCEARPPGDEPRPPLCEARQLAVRATNAVVSVARQVVGDVSVIVGLVRSSVRNGNTGVSEGAGRVSCAPGRVDEPQWRSQILGALCPVGDGHHQVRDLARRRRVRRCQRAEWPTGKVYQLSSSTLDAAAIAALTPSIAPLLPLATHSALVLAPTVKIAIRPTSGAPGDASRSTIEHTANGHSSTCSL